MIKMQTSQKVRLAELISQDKQSEKITDMENEHYITLSSYGKGAHERIIKDGKYPVPFLGYRVSAGQFIYSRIDARNGAYDIVGPELDGFVVSKDFPIYDINIQRVIPRFLLWSVLGNGFIQQVKQSSFGATNRMRIKEEILESYTIYLPNFAQQEEIVNSLDSLQHIINKRRRELELFDDLVKARFVEMFDDIKDICDVGYYIKSLTAGKSLAGEAECENKVLKTGAASFDYFDASQVKNLPLDYEPQAEHLVKAGDIIISRMNTAELTGAAAYVWDIQENVYLPDRLWKANLNDECNPIFVWQMLIQPATKEQIRRECSGTSGSMKNISKPGMLALKVKKVPFELQNQFAEFVKQVDKSKVAVQKSLDETKKLFDSLMQEYFG